MRHRCFSLFFGRALLGVPTRHWRRARALGLRAVRVPSHWVGSCPSADAAGAVEAA